jgi:hypothetical protein
VGMEVRSRCRNSLSTQSQPNHCDQILGFDTHGQPVTPVASNPNAADAAAGAGTLGRRDKLGWEDITKNSAKVISFIG